MPFEDDKRLGDYDCAKNWEFWFSVIIEYFTAPPDPLPPELRQKMLAPSPADTRYAGVFDQVDD